MCVWFDARFARREQASDATGGKGDGCSGGIVLATGQNRPERNPSPRPGSAALARLANRDAGCFAAVRPHGRMRDRPGADISPATWRTSGRGRQAIVRDGPTHATKVWQG